jgi:hypothetical protein
MALFLSYATEDQDAALDIAKWFGRQGIEVYYWSDVERQSGQIVHRIEGQIYEANAFIALVSPDYFASGWCRRERDLALVLETERQENNRGYTFVYVLRVSSKSCPRPGFLRGYYWFDATSPHTRQETLRSLIREFRSSRETPPMKHRAAGSRQGSSRFVNRHLELTNVIDGLTQEKGPHFWLVISPPELGKSWFLDRLSIELEHPEAFASAVRGSKWATRLVDVREQPPEARGKADLILASLFGLTPGVTIDSGRLHQIARRIIEGGQSHLCLLDSAELLEDEAVATLRSSLGQVYEVVKQSDDPTVQLAFVVASRHERGWRGLVPPPRLSPLALTEFDEDVVTSALDSLAQEMNRSFRSSQLAEYGALLHHLTDGLPALLVRSLQWVQTEEWRDMGRLASQETFEKLVHIYVEKGLLSLGTLFPWEEQHLEGRQRILEEVFRVLSRYRFFTQSHLHNIFDHNPALRESLGNVGWSIENLWTALDRTPLLTQPLDEPWHEIYPAIRRLLFRFYYRSAQERFEAHRQARGFVEVWTAQQAGTELIVGLVECLWHEASMLRPDQPEALRDKLNASAKKLSLMLRSSSISTVVELREEAAELLMKDKELQETLNRVPGLLEQLADTIVSPSQKNGP